MQPSRLRTSRKVHDVPGPRLIRLEAKGLLRRFNHVIDFPADWTYVILHGPNGVGKTKLLEIVEAVFTGKPSKVLEYPFDSVYFRFDDGTKLSISNSEQLSLFDQKLRDREFSLSTRTVSFRLARPGGDVAIWESGPSYVVPSAEVMDYLARRVPLGRLVGGYWRDHRSSERMTDQEVLAKYADLLPHRVPPTQPMPGELISFIDSISVHLIETQRLLAGQSAPRVAAGPRSRPLRRSRVLEYADDLARRLRGALAENSTISQRLDRTFPRRLLAEGVSENAPTEAVIRARYDEQRELRNALTAIAVLDMAEDLPLPPRALELWERVVLSTYLDDADKKLATFQSLLSRVTLLKQIVTARFEYKDMVIDRDKGFLFAADGVEISPDMLSSGEQHELVLLYDLLFNVSPGSLVLIDEPEISLHVGWQQRFLADLGEIGELNNLRFIVATHSPQIVHKSWNRTVALGSRKDDSGALEREADH
ncbi:AAA family ATPase [Micromonospora sp. RB23]